METIDWPVSLHLFVKHAMLGDVHSITLCFRVQNTVTDQNKVLKLKSKVINPYVMSNCPDVTYHARMINIGTLF